VLDADGVHGVVSDVLEFADVVRAPVGGMLSPVLMRAGGGGEPVRGRIDVPLRQPLIVNPLGDPLLLAALGRAGRGVRIGADAPLFSSRTRMTIAGMPQGFCAAGSTVQGPAGPSIPDLAPRPQGRPGPYEERVKPDGTRLSYDGDGLLSEVHRPDGTKLAYAEGRLASEERPDGSATIYDGGQIAKVNSADRSYVSYQDGKPAYRVSSGGLEQAVAATPGTRAAAAPRHR
jgi:YD repeat-containing protein